MKAQGLSKVGASHRSSCGASLPAGAPVAALKAVVTPEENSLGTPAGRKAEGCSQGQGFTYRGVRVSGTSDLPEARQSHRERREILSVKTKSPLVKNPVP